MAKIVQKTPIIFGSGASAAPRGIAGPFGSLANNYPSDGTYSLDPDIIQSSTQWLGGWNLALVGGASPALEDMNAVNYVNSYQNAYILQQGIGEWNSGITYYVDSVVTYNGLIYISLVNGNLNNNPASLGSYWTFAASPSGGSNIIYNGSMGISQGVTSGTITASTPAYTVDGFIVDSVGANTAWTQTILNGISCLQLTPSGTLTDLYVKQRVESTQMQLTGSEQTFTFQAKVYNYNAGSITPKLTVNNPTSADNYGSVTNIINAVSLQVVPGSAGSAVVSYTFSTASTSAQYGLEVILDFGSSVPSAGTIYVTNFAVTPTPYASVGLNGNPPTFSAGSLATELLKCMRYYQLWTFTGGTLPIFMSGFTFGTTNGYLQVPLLAPMFGTPAIDTLTTATGFNCIPLGGGAQQVSSFGTVYQIGNSLTVLVNTGGSWSEGVGLYMIPHSSTKCVFAVNSRF